MAEQKNQHTVPQFYLKRFSSNGKSIRKCLVGSNKIINNASIRGTAAKDYFYGDELYMEKTLQSIEERAAKVFREIESTEAFPDQDSEEYNYLCHYIALQEARSLRTAEVWKQFCLQSIYQYAKLEKEAGKNVPFDPEDVFKDVIVNNPANTAIKSAAFPVLKMNYLTPFLIINKSRIPFITSDNPTICYNSLLVGLEEYAFGWAFLGVEVFFPLSPKMLLCFIDSEAYLTDKLGSPISLTNEKKITDFNRLICLNAFHEIYFPDELTDEELRLLFPYLKPRSLYTPSFPETNPERLIHGITTQCPREQVHIPIFHPRHDIQAKATKMLIHPEAQEIQILAKTTLNEVEQQAQDQKNALKKN